MCLSQYFAARLTPKPQPKRNTEDRARQMHAAGVLTRLAAERAGATSLFDSVFGPRAEQLNTGAGTPAQQELEAAEYIVGLKHRDLICSLTHALVKDPVYTSDGQMYERERILTYWNATGNIRSPLTGLTLDNRVLRPAIMLKNVIDRCVDFEISSGKAAALAGSDLSVNANKAILIEGLLQQMNATQTPDLLLGNLLALCENVYLRDFAARCGALHVAAACYHRTHSDTTASFLVRMVVFSRDNQEELAFVAREATTALRSTDVQVQTRAFHVLTALVADGTMVQRSLEEHLPEVLSPVFADNAPRVDAHPCLFTAALFFLVHLLVGRRSSTTRRVVDAGGPAIARHVLETMDTAAKNLACWFFSLLGELDRDEKKRLSETLLLDFNFETALETQECFNFALTALLVINGPRRSIRAAVNVMSVSREDSRMHLPVLSLLVNATRTPCVDATTFGPKPSTDDVVDYVCLHMPSVIEVVEHCSKALDHASVEKGVELLANICHVFERMDPPCSARRKNTTALFINSEHWGRISVVVANIVENILCSTSIVEPTHVPWQAPCAKAFAMLCQYMSLMTDEEFQNIIPAATHDLVGACLDILEYVKIFSPHNVPRQSPQVLDVVLHVLLFLKFTCSRIEYEYVGHTNVAAFLIENISVVDDDTIAFNTLQTLQVFVCSSSEPAQFWELRGASARNRAFRKEIVDEQLGLIHLFDLLKAPPNTKSEEIAILTLLRDIVPSIPSIRKKRQDDAFHTEFVKLMLVKIDANLRLGEDGCNLTVAICCETLASMLIANESAPKSIRLPEWRALLRQPQVADSMMGVLTCFGARRPTPTYVLEQALRVIVMLITRGFSSNVSAGLPLLRDHQLADGFTTMETLQRFSTLMQALCYASGDTDCLRCGCEPAVRVYSPQARCRELVCGIALHVLGEDADEAVAFVFMDSSFVEAILAVLEQSDREPAEAASHMTPSGTTFVIHVLQALVSFFPAYLAAKVASAFGRLILKDISDKRATVTMPARAQAGKQSGDKRDRGRAPARAGAGKKKRRGGR